jgi:polyketide synthase PksL
LYGERQPRRISLPTYPFARERYWVPQSEETVAPTTIQGKLHTLVHENTSVFMQQQFTSRFQGNEFFFRDHRMREELVLPGVAYLEMARVAGELSANQPICQIKNVGWIKPINAGTAPQEVVICLSDERNQISFKVFTGSARSTARAEGFLVTGNALATKRLALEDIERRCTRKILGKDDCYQIFEKHGAHYGPSFRALKTVAIGENELLATLALPSHLEQSAGDFLLHPALLDGALQASIGLGLHSDQSSLAMGLPFALDELTIHRKLSHSMVAYVRYSHGSGPTENVPELDIDLCDDDGEICIAFHRVAFRSVPSSISKPVVHDVSETVDKSSVLILQPVWKPAETAPKAVPPHYGARDVILVEFDQAVKTAIDQHLASPSILLESRQAGIEARYSEHAKSIFSRLKEILLEKPKHKVLVQVVVPLENVSQVYSGLGALLSTVKQENPKITGQVLAMPKATAPHILIDRLEQNTRQFDLFVRYRDSICEQRNWEQAHLVLDQLSTWNATDRVLITGGAGRLGRLIAIHLASGAPGIKLFLSGRSVPSSRTDSLVQELTQLGALATYLQADISDRTDVKNVVSAILRDGGPLTAVVHAAGVIHDNFILKKNVDELEQVLAPKTGGLVYLDESTSDHNLKHFIAFASSAGALGNIGQADYAAANAFMDAYCQYRTTLVAAGQRHGKSTAIDWPLWQDGGMKAPESIQKMIEQKFGLTALSTPSGLKAFDQCLQYPSSQLLVLSGVRHKIADSLGIKIVAQMPPASTPLPGMDEKWTSIVEAIQSSNVAHPHEISLSQTAQTLRERASAFIKEACSNALKIPLTQLQNRRSFSSYGIDSLVVADITNELEKGLGALPKTLFFQYQNIDELTTYLLENHKEQLQELLQEKGSVSSPADAVKQGTLSRKEPRGVASTDKKSKAETITVVRPGDALPTRQTAAQSGQYGELILKSELSSSHKALLKSIAGEAFFGSYLFDLWHWFYISRNKDAFIHASLDENKTLFVTCYQGIAGGEHEFLRELSDFAQAHQYQICYWSFFPPDPALEQNGWVSSPIGTVQVIQDLANFDLSGTRNRKLRYVVNRFAQAGQCETRECAVLTNEILKQVIDVISAWCEQKKFVHSVKPFIAELKEGTWRRRYRMFLTWLDGVLQNVVLITGHAKDGCLMDQEYYRPDMPIGGIEYALVEIINCLKSEGCRYFSLGMTWGVSDYTQGSDQEGRALLAEMKQKDTFLSRIFEQGEKNYRFKNKFQPVNDASCFYRSAGTQPEVIIRFLSMFMEKGVAFAEIQKLLNQVPPVPSETQNRIEYPESSRTQDEDRFFDVTKVAPDDVRLHMISDSWVYLRNKNVTSRIQELIGRIDPACDYEAVIRDVFGCPHIHLAPLGRTAEKLFFQSVSGNRGKIVTNLLFETAIHNLVSQGFQLLETPDRKVFELNHSELFRGGIDPEGLQNVLNHHKSSVKMIFLELGNNASGGHPISMAQLRQTASFATQHNLMLVLDITRIVKNAILVREYEPGYQDVDIWNIVREIVSNADCIVGSLSKEFGVNMGGIVGSKHQNIITAVRQFARMEGGYISEIERGIIGEAFRELTFIEASCTAQIKSTKTIRRTMEQAGIPCVSPAVSHCIVVPARRISGYDSRKYASESFLQWFWEKTGIRGGVHLAGNQKNSTLNACARFCIPMGFTPDQEQWAVQRIGELSTNASQNALSQLPAPAPIVARKYKWVSGTDIAIVGMSGRFPGARGIHEFWANLKSGVISIGEIPKNRWDWQKVFEKPQDPRVAAVRWGGFMPDVDKFDSGFFDISPREAKLMDPQQRLMLLCAWETIEDAGYTRRSLKQSKTGVFIACPSGVSSHNGNMHELDRVIGLGTVGSIAANRISYHFDLSGPSETYDTSCSSSFVALHRAIHSILLGDCSQAIVGGVQVLSDSGGFKDIASIGFLSRAGRVRSFDDHADGYIRSESVAAVLIKPLESAIAAGDHIYAVIKGTGLCHGGNALSITTPSVNGMKEAMLQAYRQAEVDPRSVQYIEAHGIASPIGDALEMEALNAAYGQLVSESTHSLPATTCHIGSLKPNLGHPEVASGMCVLIKTVMALRERVLPGILGFERLNSQIAMKNTPFAISSTHQEWNSITDQEGGTLPRRASINSYGVGGVNTHVLLEEYLANERVDEEGPPQENKSLLFIFSARQHDSLDNYVKKFIQYLQSVHPGSSELESIAYTLQIGRESLEKRLAVFSSSNEELVGNLQFYLAHSSDLDALARHRIFAGHSHHVGVNGNGASSVDEQEKIARSWAAGAEISWRDFYTGRRLKRVSLPTYVFSEERYEMPAPQVIPRLPAASKSQSNGHQGNGAVPSASVVDSNDAAPRNEIERRIAEIWSEVLGVDRIGIHDDFFELGGHSVLALQLTNRMAGASFDCSMRELYRHPTIFKLSQCVRSRETSSSLPARSFPLLPIQALLISRLPANDSSSRDAMPSFLEIHADVDEKILVRALQNWYAQDIFRLRFQNSLGEWRQYYSPETCAAPIRWHDAGQPTDVHEEHRALLQLAQEMERDLNILSGPLIQIGLVKCEGRLKYMVWITDHLVIDNFSFFTLLTNLKLCYQYAGRDTSFQFSCDTIIAEWAERQFEAAYDERVIRELEFWKKHFPVGHQGLLAKHENCGPRLIQSFTAVLNEAETVSCFASLAANKMTLEELCLVSLLMGYQKCSHASNVLLRIAANGREEDVEGLDLTRGLGWFSVVYPALFHLDPGDTQASFLESAIQQYRAYLDKRSHYGLLRYMNHHLVPELQAAEDWSQCISFNCFGDIDPKSKTDDLFHLANGGFTALLEFTEQRQDYDRGLWFFIMEGKLHIRVFVRTGAFKQDEMEDLLRETKRSLLELCGTIEPSKHLTIAHG